MYRLTLKFKSKTGEILSEVREDKSLPKVQNEAKRLIEALPAFGHVFHGYEIVAGTVDKDGNFIPRGWDSERR